MRPDNPQGKPAMGTLNGSADTIADGSTSYIRWLNSAGLVTSANRKTPTHFYLQNKTGGDVYYKLGATTMAYDDSESDASHGVLANGETRTFAVSGIQTIALQPIGADLVNVGDLDTLIKNFWAGAWFPGVL